MSNPHRRTCSSPAWGPVPVTTVPVTSASAVMTVIAPTRRLIAVGTAECSRGSGDDRRTATRANAIEAIARRKCDCTSAGCRSARTARPPTTALASTVTSTPIEGPTRPGRRGLTRNEPITISTVGIVMAPLISRLICSMAACRARHVDERLRIAVRPVVAAQPAAGQPDDPAGYDQQAETAGGEGGDQPELAHAQGPAIHVPSRI